MLTNELIVLSRDMTKMKSELKQKTELLKKTEKERAEKKARIIKSNQTITVPAHKIPAFKVCKSFKNAVSIKNPC